jgi:hypothetical protein
MLVRDYGCYRNLILLIRVSNFLRFVSFPDPEIISPFFFFKKTYLCGHNVTEAGIDLTFPTSPVYW